MGTSPLLQADIGALAARYGNEIITEQINNDVPILGSGALEKIKSRGKLHVVNIVGGGLDSTSFIADGGAMQSGSSSVPLQGSVAPVHILTRISIGRGAAMLAAGVEDSVDMVKFQLENAGRDAARKMGRSLFSAQLNPDGYMAAPSSPVVGVYTDVRFADVSGVREGDAVVLYDTSASDTFLLEVIKVTPAAVNSNSANVAGWVTLANTVQGTDPGRGTPGGAHEDGDLPDIASDDTFWLRGKYSVTGAGGTAAAQTVPVSFADISGSASLHGLDPAGNAAGYGWTGITASSFGVLTQESLSAVSQRVRSLSGRMHSHLVLHPAAAASFAASAVSAGTAFGFAAGAAGAGRRLTVGADRDALGSVMDKYESGLRFMGKPVLIEPNCAATEIVFHNRDAVKLCEWKDFSPESEGDGAVLVDRTSFSYDIQLSAASNLSCSQRRAMARATGVTSL